LVVARRPDGTGWVTTIRPAGGPPELEPERNGHIVLPQAAGDEVVAVREGTSQAPGDEVVAVREEPRRAEWT